MKAWRDRLVRTVRDFSTDVLLLNPVKGAPGPRGTERSPVHYTDTVAPSYLWGRFSATFPAEPVYFLQLAAQLRARGIRTEIADRFSHRFDAEDVLAVSACFDARIVAVAFFHNTVDDTVHFARRLKQRDPNVTVVVGSAYAPPRWTGLLAECAIDFVGVVGVGERALADLASAVLSGEPVTDLPGLASSVDGLPLAVNVQLAQRMAYYDLYLFTRRLVDLSVNHLGAEHSASMDKIGERASWLDDFRHDAGGVGSFQVPKVGELFQLMGVLTTLLVQALQPGGPVETGRLVQARDRVIDAHYDAFATAHAVVADAATPLAFDDIVTHAASARRGPRSGRRRDVHRTRTRGSMVMRRILSPDSGDDGPAPP